MAAIIKKVIVYVLFLAVIVTAGFPVSAFSQERNRDDSRIMPMEEELSGNDEGQAVTYERPIIKFGPYKGAGESKEHAYEPFNVKEKKDNVDSKNFKYKRDRILIKLQSGGSSTESVSTSFRSHGVKDLEPVFPVGGAKGSSKSLNRVEQNLVKWYKAYLEDGTDVLAVVEALKKEPGVITAEPDYVRNIEDLEGSGSALPGETGEIGDLESEETVRTAVYAGDTLQSATYDTDPKLGEQWYLDRVGIKQAWTYLEAQGINPGGSRDVVVAVIDTGVDYYHPELAGNMWTNTGEIPFNGIDDDQNGFIDDIHGACTVGSRYSGESGDPIDDHGHGTHVAGIIAAQAGNGIGGAGVAHNVQIMALKAAQSSGLLAASDIAQAIYYAVDKGADVINMSFGGYGRSTVEEDALQVAFGSAVLVASAGNNGKPNLPHPKGADLYPAAYNWVLGVMAERRYPAANGDNLAGFSNWDYIPQDSHEYEVMAPGVDIFSTLPNERYAKWDGTSMSAPVVSGIAALVRSKFSDKDAYSSRFIMGQIASTGELKQGKTYSFDKPPVYYKEVNAYRALTDTPRPELSYIEHYVFDKEDIAAGNDGDGVVDAGETIDLAMVIRNHWGKADNVRVKLDTVGSGGMADPYVQFITDTVDYGAVGNFAIDDNGLIYENDVVTGVNHPFRLKISEDTPNDHVIPVNITLTCNNGFDPGDSTTYSFNDHISLVVRKGVELPGVISQDMTLTKDKYWIVPNATLIEEGAIVTVEPGTQIQFWSSEPEDPYAEKPMAYIEVRGRLLVNGTAEEPVEMFASALYPGYEVKIYSTDYLDQYGYASENYQGYAELNYVKVMNPNIAVNKIDHCYFSQDLFDRMYKRYLYEGQVRTIDYYGPIVYGKEISNSKFYHLGINPYNSSTIYKDRMLRLRGLSQGNLFDSCLYYMDELWAENNTYLKNYKLYETQYGDRTYWASKGKEFGYGVAKSGLKCVFPTEYNGKTYTALSLNYNFIRGLPDKELFYFAEKFANQLGGHVVTINDQAENDFLKGYIASMLNNRTLFEETYPNLLWDYYNGYGIIGLNDYEQEGEFKWIGAEYSSFTNWGTDQPIDHGSDNYSYNLVYINNYDGKWHILYNSNIQYCPILLELPGTITQEDLDNVLVETIKNNAILNRWWDPDVSHWMRFTSEEGDQYKRYLSQNYWGTTSETLIEKALIHFNDFRNMEEIIYKPILTQAPETAYPFVTDVYVSTQTEERATRVGAETIEVHVLFNRDMDTGIQPQVSFGPDMPTTDYTVNPVEGGWVSPRHWVGQTKITPMTGDGYQFFRVAGAVAADDPWLVTGNDTERYRFEIITSGTEAMNLQATGGEGKVTLNWTQDDFDMLAGYNLYRSLASDGSYTKINSTVIPADQKTYEDTNVQPGTTYFYKFTVVKTDLTESDYSNVAAAAPFDTVPPVINHTPVQSAAMGMPLQIYADVTDNVAVAKVDLYYRQTGTMDYTVKQMTGTTGNRYSATLEGSLVQAPGIDYYIEATDGISTVRSGGPDTPHAVVVTDAPKVTSVSPAQGPASGGTSVVITGANFKEGAGVAFGQAVASNVVVENANRITAVAPAHYPATVDVTVTNPDQYKDTLLRAFTYISEGVEVSIPDAAANTGQTFEVPVNVSGVSGLRSAEVKVTFDAELLAVKNVRLGSITSNFSLATNTGTPGAVTLSMASATTVSGSGSLAHIEFEVLDSTKTSSPLTLADVSLNSGNIIVNTVNGTFNVAATYSISGSVSYYNNYRPVSGVDLTLTGTKTYTGASNQSGTYSINDIQEGAYTLTAGKSDQATDISAYDASLILQNSLGLISLSERQIIAADVDNNSWVNAMDAAYVLEKAVDLLQPPFPGAGKVWTFIPAERNYTNINNNLTSQNFTAVLIGDVSGNWGETSSTAIQSVPGQAEFTLGTVRAEQGSQVTVPMELNTGNEKLYSAYMEITYDASVAKAVSVDKTDLAKNFTMVANLNSPGKIKIAVAGALPASGAGKLLNIRFEAVGNAGAETVLEINRARANETVPSATNSGKLIINHVDKFAPVVSEVEPAKGNINVPVDKVITVTFNEDIQAGVAYRGISLKGDQGANVKAMVSINGKKLIIKPGTNLACNTRYTVHIPARAVKDMAGNLLAAPYTFDFTTQVNRETDAPTVASTDPVDGAVAVPVVKTITVSFNEDIQQGDTYNNIELKDANGNIIAVTRNIRDARLILKPKSRLDYGTEYIVTVPAGAVEDEAGNSLVKSYTFTFTTQARRNTLTVSPMFRSARLSL